jgi:hypothetical protein
MVRHEKMKTRLPGSTAGRGGWIGDARDGFVASHEASTAGWVPHDHDSVSYPTFGQRHDRVGKTRFC